MTSHNFQKTGKSITVSEDPKLTVNSIKELPYLTCPTRKIRDEIYQYLGYRMQVDPADGVTPMIEYYPVTEGKDVVGWKSRDLTKPKKSAFRTVGRVDIGSELINTAKTKPGRRLYITEGEHDLAACIQAFIDSLKGTKHEGVLLGKTYKGPLYPNFVSILLGAGNAEENITKNATLTDKYEEIVTVFDSDKATPKERIKNFCRGYEATCEVSLLLGSDRHKYVPLALKDPCEYIQQGRQSELADLLSWHRQDFVPITIEEGDKYTIEELMEPLRKGVTISCLPKTSEMIGGLREHEMTLIIAPSKSGKCFSKQTLIMMFDGTTKFVEDILPGDLLMGPDSNPRTVDDIVCGREQMYWIRQNKGVDYRVNESHVLSLVWGSSDGTRKKGQTTNISVKDYVSESNNFKHMSRGHKASIDFQKRLPIWEPYFLGLWLADGTSAESIITIHEDDEELREYTRGFASKYDLKLSEKNDSNSKGVRHRFSGRGGFLKNELRIQDVLNDKHIPLRYLIASRRERLELLAGLLDGDGYLSNSIKESWADYEICQSNDKIAEGLLRLCWSLGFRATTRIKHITLNGKKHTTNRMRISGDLNKIPLKLKRKSLAHIDTTPKRNPLWTGIQVEKDIVDDYYGFTLKEDPLFLLGDFTVAHNTTLTKQIAYDINTDPELKDTKIGNIFLEETGVKTRQSYIALDNNVAINLYRENPSILTKEQVSASYEKLFRGKNLFLDTKSGILSPDEVVKHLKHLASLGCKNILLDHLSLVISGSTKNNERKEIDNLLTEMAGIVESKPIHIVVVAHIKRTDFKPKTDDSGEIIYPYWFPVNIEDARGSGAFSQIFWNGIILEPEILDEFGNVGRVRTKVAFCREWGSRGLGDTLKYNPKTGRLEKAIGEPVRGYDPNDL